MLHIIRFNVGQLLNSTSKIHHPLRHRKVRTVFVLLPPGRDLLLGEGVTERARFVRLLHPSFAHIHDVAYIRSYLYYNNYNNKNNNDNNNNNLRIKRPITLMRTFLSNETPLVVSLVKYLASGSL